MFDIGFSEMILIAVIALIAIGPKQLPEVARVAGRLLNQIKGVTGEFQRTLAEAGESANKALHEAREALEQPVIPSEERAPHGHPPVAHSTEPDQQTVAGEEKKQMSFDLGKKES